MTTTITLFAAASVTPTISISVNQPNEFVTGCRSISIGEYNYDPKSASLAQEKQAEFIDADDFLNNLLLKHDIEKDLPEARRWLARELYDDSRPTLAALRLKKGLTQKQLASRVHEPQSSISRLESGDESPSIDRAARLAEALEISLDQFYLALTASRESGKV